MKQNSILLSICIPTFNRGKYIEECLNSITTQRSFIDLSIEIVVSDNCSTDNTENIVNYFINKFKNIKYFKNKKNIGPGLNVFKSVSYASGKYVWIIGDDDKINDGGVKKVFDTLLVNNDLGWLYVNYYTFNEKLNKITCESQLHNMNKGCENNFEKNKLIITDGNSIYLYINGTPTFLPSLIMKKTFFKKSDIHKFSNNVYPHTGICTLNTKNNKIGLITEPLIRGFLPKKGWHKNGNTLFEAEIDYLYINYIVYNDARCPFNSKKYGKYKSNFLKRYFKLIILSKALGLKIKKEDLHKMRLIFGNGIIYNLYLKLFIYLPFGKIFRLLLPNKYL